jgi:hypothetical protein
MLCNVMQMSLTKPFWRTATALVDILAPLVAAMRRLEADNAFISIVVPTLDSARRDVLAAARKCKAPQQWLKSLDDIMGVYIDKYVTPAQVAALFLDPKQKMTVDQEKELCDQAVEFLVGYVDEADREAVQHQFERYRYVRRAMFGDGGTSVNEPTPEQGVTPGESRISMLVSSPNVLAAWRYGSVRSAFPLLSTVASVLLGIRASSGSVERYFSVVRLVHTHLRNRLKAGACRELTYCGLQSQYEHHLPVSRGDVVFVQLGEWVRR